jgi:hypothetical protein
MNTDKLIQAAERVAELLALRGIPAAVRLALKDARDGLQDVIAAPEAGDVLSKLDHVWAGLANARDALNASERTAVAGHCALRAVWDVQDVLREREAA